ncbi:MAG: lysophospholipid acyltransferase family protein [Desulfobulbaceae bacterium]|nr:lysophospholipid acyltransferase family protein [Desulfobulbaceae bacterium]
MNNRPLRKKLRDDFFYLLALSFIKFLRLIPRRPALRLMRLLARLAFPFASAPRQRTIIHLARVYGKSKNPQQIKALARAVFVHFATVFVDVVRMPVIIRSGINKMVSTEGTEHFDRAFKVGKGVILTTCHFGNFELLGAWMAQNGYPMKVIGTTLFDPRLDQILLEIRKCSGNSAISRGKSTREIIRTLKNGAAVGMLIDQDTKSQGVFVNFFNKPAHTPTGPAVLARRLDVPIIPAFMYLKDDFSYHLECQPPLELVRTDDEDHDIIVNTQKISDAYEAMIRRYPEQWVWMHKRWKTQPIPATDNEVN